MAALLLRKVAGNMLVADDEESAELLGRVPIGAVVSATMAQRRNYRFHKKFMSLVRLAFEYWRWPEPVVYRGIEVRASFEKFRSDLLVMSGHYDAVFNARGEVRLEGKSISFANCDEVQFDRFYNDVLTKVVEHISDRISRQQIEATVEATLRGYC